MELVDFFDAFTRRPWYEIAPSEFWAHFDALVFIDPVTSNY